MPPKTLRDEYQRLVFACKECDSTHLRKRSEKEPGWFCKHCRCSVEAVRREPEQHGAADYGLKRKLLDMDASEVLGDE